MATIIEINKKKNVTEDNKTLPFEIEMAWLEDEAMRNFRKTCSDPDVVILKNALVKF